MLKMLYRTTCHWAAGLSLAAITVAAAATVETPPPETIDRIAAIVNDDVITASELEQRLTTLTKQLRQQRTPMPPRAVLRRQVLERMVINRIQLQIAEASGIRIDDETLNKTIGNIAAQNKLTLSQFRDVLEKDGFSFAQFREEMRQEIIIRRLLQRQVESRISVTEQEIDNFLVNQKTQGKAHDEYHLGHILIALPEAATPAEIRQARERAQGILEELRQGRDFSETAIAVSDGQQALKGGDLGWRKSGELPTLFVDVVRNMKVGEISDLIRSPSGFHIIKLLEHRSGQRHLVAQSHARHILIRPGGLISEKQALETARELRRRLLAGEDFAQLAKEYSDDKASAVDGGDLGWVSPGQMVPEFEQALTKLEPGAISEPVKSGFGWHLIQVLERRQHDDTDEFTRKQARKQIFQRKVEEAQANWLRRLRDEAYVEYRL